MRQMTQKFISINTVVIAAGLITIMVGLGTILGWITGPKSSLEGLFSVSIYQEPTSITDVVDGVSDALLRLDEDIVDALADNEVLLPGVSSVQVSSVIRSVTDDLEDRRRALLQRHTLGGYLMGVVSNSGSTTLDNVRLYLPGAVEVEFHVDGDVRSLREELGTIPVLVLGTLPPGANVTVFAWTRPEVISQFSTLEIRLVHGDGYGDVSIQVPTGRIGQWAERIGPIGFGLFGGLIAILAALLIMDFAARRNQNQS